MKICTCRVFVPYNVAGIDCSTGMRWVVFTCRKTKFICTVITEFLEGWEMVKNNRKRFYTVCLRHILLGLLWRILAGLSASETAFYLVPRHVTPAAYYGMFMPTSHLCMSGFPTVVTPRTICVICPAYFWVTDFGPTVSGNIFFNDISETAVKKSRDI